MKRIQSLRLGMYLATQVELQAIVQAGGQPGLAAALDVLSARLADGFRLHEIQTQTLPPRTAARDDVLDAMIALALAVAGPLAAHAHAHGLHEVEAVADVTPRSFRRPRLVERPTVAQRIHDAARPLLAVLQPFGITAPMLAALQAKIDAAKAILHEPRTIIIDKHKATTDLAALFRTIDALLERRIDRLLAPLALTHPGLHARYFSARKMPRRPRASATPAAAETAATAAPATETAPAAPAAPAAHAAPANASINAPTNAPDAAPANSSAKAPEIAAPAPVPRATAVPVAAAPAAAPASASPASATPPPPPLSRSAFAALPESEASKPAEPPPVEAGDHDRDAALSPLRFLRQLHAAPQPGRRFVFRPRRYPAPAGPGPFSMQG